MTPGAENAAATRFPAPRRRRLPSWLLPMIAAGAILLLAGWWIIAHRYPSGDGYRSLVRALGWISTVLMLAAAAFSFRKRMAYQGIGKLSVWLSAHLYLGVVAAVAVVLHAGFQTGGFVSTMLFLAFAVTIVTGLAGWWISWYVPKLLTAVEEGPSMIEDLIAEKEENLRGLFELARDGSAELKAAIETVLLRETQSRRRMMSFYRNRSHVADELPRFESGCRQAARGLPAIEHSVFSRAAEYALRANKMESEIFLHQLLRSWVKPHIVATAFSYGFMLIHIGAQLYY